MAHKKDVKQGNRLYGFGFDPEQSRYHFAVTVPRSKRDVVTVVERFTWNAAGREAGQDVRSPALKVSLDHGRWESIADAVRVEFNRRLRNAGMHTASWKVGENLLAPYFGKELTLLAWAIESADAAIIPNMIANWLGLEPEERWWLYTTINATIGHPEHRPDRGWRKAIKVAFAENPSVAPSPSQLAPAESEGSDIGSKPAQPRRSRRKQADTGADEGQARLPLSWGNEK